MAACGSARNSRGCGFAGRRGSSDGRRVRAAEAVFTGQSHNTLKRQNRSSTRGWRRAESASVAKRKITPLASRFQATRIEYSHQSAAAWVAARLRQLARQTAWSWWCGANHVKAKGSLDMKDVAVRLCSEVSALPSPEGRMVAAPVMSPQRIF